MQVVNKLWMLADLGKVMRHKILSKAPIIGLDVHSLTDNGKVSLLLNFLQSYM